MSARCTHLNRISIEIMPLEVEIEKAWLQLRRMRDGRVRSIYLSTTGKLLPPSEAHQPHCMLVGAYTNTYELRDFRDDVFSTYGEMMRGR